MVAGRGLLEHFVAEIALVFRTPFSQTLEQGLSFVLALRGDVDVSHHGYAVAFSHRRPRINHETVMHTLIVRAIVNGLELGSAPAGMLGPFMRLEGRLISPNFNDDEAGRPGDLLDNIYSRISPLQAAGFPVLL